MCMCLFVHNIYISGLQFLKLFVLLLFLLQNALQDTTDSNVMRSAAITVQMKNVYIRMAAVAVSLGGKATGAVKVSI